MCQKWTLDPPFDLELSEVFKFEQKKKLFHRVRDLRALKAMCRISGMTYFFMKIRVKIRHMRFARHMQSVGKSKIFLIKSYGMFWTSQI